MEESEKDDFVNFEDLEDPQCEESLTVYRQRVIEDQLYSCTRLTVLRSLAVKYCKAGEKITRKYVNSLLTDFEEVMGEAPENVRKSLDIMFGKKAKSYTIEQLHEAIKLAEDSMGPVLTAELDVKRLPNLEAIGDEDFLKYSREVVIHKLKNNKASISEVVLVNQKPAKEYETDEMPFIIETIFNVCNFTISNIDLLREQIRSSRAITANTIEIAQQLLRITKSPDEKLTVRLIQKLMLAYIDENEGSKIAAIDLNNELKLYQIERPATYLVSQTKKPATVDPSMKSREFGDTLKEAISLYERLIAQDIEEGEDPKSNQAILFSLKQEYAYKKNKEPDFRATTQTMRASVSQSKLHPLDRKRKGLSEVFHFYTKQKANANTKKTFDAVQNEISSMNLGLFLRFAKDFDLPIDSKELQELFKKFATAGKSLSLDKLQEILEILSLSFHRSKISALEKKLNENKGNPINHTNEESKEDIRAIELKLRDLRLSALFDIINS